LITSSTPQNKYIQYLLNLTTENVSISPIIQEVTINYQIPDFNGIANEDYYFIRLSDYFSDPDGDLLNYSASNSSNIVITIDGSSWVLLNSNYNWDGTDTVYFTASDSVSLAYSNNVTMIYDPGSTTYEVINTPSSGGGSSSNIQIKTKTINQTEIRYLKIIAPGKMTAWPNGTVIIPIRLVNNGTVDLTGISLTADSDNPNVSLKFQTKFFSFIVAGKEEKTELVAIAGNASGTLSITVYANSTSPQVKDSTVIQIELVQNISQRINSVKDILTLNPECLELSELVVKAEKAIAEHRYDSAASLLDTAVEGCRSLLLQKQNSTIQLSPDKEEFSIFQANRVEIMIVIIAMLMLILTLYVIFRKPPTEITI
jgi:hypothetical protein